MTTIIYQILCIWGENKFKLIGTANPIHNQLSLEHLLSTDENCGSIKGTFKSRLNTKGVTTTDAVSYSYTSKALDQDSVVCMKTWHDWEHIQYIAEASSGMFLKIVATRLPKNFILKLSHPKK